MCVCKVNTMIMIKVIKAPLIYGKVSTQGQMKTKITQSLIT